jgi:agmatinase
MSELFQLSHYVRAEGTSSAGVHLYHEQTGTSTVISPQTLELLKMFKEPKELDSLPNQLGFPHLPSVLERLCKDKVLMPVRHQGEDDATVGYCEPPVVPFLLTPNVGTRARNCDLVFVGVPFDLASTGFSGSRAAPTSLRRWSQSMPYRINNETLRPAGWYCVERNERILEGVTIGDLGNFKFDPAEPLKDIYQRITEFVAQSFTGSSFPVFIGGDHAITYPIICGLTAGPVGIIQFDAHTDFAELHPNREHHHGNVMRRANELAQVCAIYQFGVSGYFPRFRLENKQHVVPRIVIRDPHALETLIERMPADLDYYLSVDVDVMDPTFAPGTGTPMPGGLSPEELEAALAAIVSKRKIIAMDLVELNIDRDFHLNTCMTAFHVLASTLGTVFKYRD